LRKPGEGGEKDPPFFKRLAFFRFDCLTKKLPIFEKVARVVKVVPPFQSIVLFSDNKILLFKMVHLGDRRTEGTEGTQLVRKEAGSWHVPVMEK
jgi:hypothetical protein